MPVLACAQMQHVLQSSEQLFGQSALAAVKAQCGQTAQQTHSLFIQHLGVACNVYVS